MKGFFVPGSRSGSYVASKRNEEGSYAYDAAAQDVGIQKQAALQELGQQYEATINNAYASYLASQRSIQSSAMGEGYKEAYLQAQQAGLQNQVAQAGASLAQTRQALGQQEAEAQSIIQKQYETEVANLDRVATSMESYLAYVKNLTPSKGTVDEGLAALGIDPNKDIESQYELLYKLDPATMATYTDENAEKGLNYLEWVNANLKDTAADKEWSQWLFSLGGWQDFQNALAARKGENNLTKMQNAKAEELKENYGETLAENANDENIEKLQMIYDKYGKEEGDAFTKAYNTSNLSYDEFNKQYWDAKNNYRSGLENLTYASSYSKSAKYVLDKIKPEAYTDWSSYYNDIKVLREYEGKPLQGMMDKGYYDKPTYKLVLEGGKARSEQTGTKRITLDDIGLSEEGKKLLNNFGKSTSSSPNKPGFNMLL